LRKNWRREEKKKKAKKGKGNKKWIGGNRKEKGRSSP